ncbi:MAG TPA: L-serine ammonia-lyase, iron-sulfur-dependent, subunit alpha [Candidatus Avoscillospira avicola]|uniref:L-serine ammonia-lyase n=1 Tax=Candidatus Avoscillospira avicola TaxID=2840706 RepID=A0A9D1DGF3_9FIRM|nr:L-serine ammonia-lyase, iron-sulfur-dependent, subunit alpha [Candidatus Avoscillospira avicola]
MKSIRDIYKIGKGPSSSHTIGPERAARLFLLEHPEADSFRVVLYGSLSKTGKGHGTDRVLREVLSPQPTEIVFSTETPPGVHHPNTMDFFAYREGAETGAMRVESIGGGDIHIEGRQDLELPEIYPENSFAEVEQFCRFRGLDLAEYVEINEGEDIWEFLDEIWRTMQRSVEEGLMTEGMLPGGLKVERKAKILFEHPAPNEVPQVRECRIISAYAFAVSEQNADCGTIVTAPTCGACGVLPASLVYVQQQRKLTDEQMLRGLAVAGLIGNLVKHNASISGAECGCQAEIGTACAMAAAALTYLFGLKTNQIQYAAEIALEHHLGLTCDPICGLVQVPCIERNAVAAMRAMNSCNLAYFLTDTQRISFDMVVKTMYETGVNLNQRFRETSEGGLAKMFNRRRHEL